MDAGDNDEGSSLTWNWAPILYRNYALSGYDRTHNFQAYGTYALPFGKGKTMLSHGIGAWLAGGWQANWILSRESGTPFSVSASATSLNSPGNSIDFMLWLRLTWLSWRKIWRLLGRLGLQDGCRSGAINKDLATGLCRSTRIETKSL